MPLDPRLHAFRPDRADARLRGQVDAHQFVNGEPAEIVVPAVGVRRQPGFDAEMLTEALQGERVLVFDREDGWAWAQLETDGYVGYVPESALSAELTVPTHRVAVPLTFCYPADDLRSQPTLAAFLNARLQIAEVGDTWSRLANGSYVFTRHLAALDGRPADPVTVASMFVNVPYRWGGKTHSGLDCSGLIQIAFHAAGRACPRDTDMIERSLGRLLPTADPAVLESGDLVFWKGHVGMMIDGQRIIHANGHHMLTVIEPVGEAIARIAAMHGPVTSFRRP